MKQQNLKDIYKNMEDGTPAPKELSLEWLTERQKNKLSLGKLSLYSGKVREMVRTTSSTYMLHTDRLSAFDKHICHIPGKGIILSQLSKYWFKSIETEVKNHYIASPHQRVLEVKSATPFKLEVIVRGYMAGSMWRSYHAGERVICGNKLPEGIKNFAKLDKPIVTPSTKAETYSHDENITPDEILAKGLASSAQWDKINSLALELFSIGTTKYDEIGWILVDTKYEFGLDQNGQIILIDEVHTPDSSRLWKSSSYAERLNNGQAPEMFDKEVLRRFLMEQGYMGDGEVPEIPIKKKLELVYNYLEIYEKLSGQKLYLEGSWEESSWAQSINKNMEKL